MKKTKQIMFRADEDTWRKISYEALNYGVSRQQLILNAVDKYIKYVKECKDSASKE